MAIHYGDNQNLDSLIEKGFVVVDFFSTTCGPCKIFSKILENLVADIPFVNIVKVNTTDFPELGEKYKIQAVPTILFLKEGEILERNVGVLQEAELKERISRYFYGN